MQSHSCFNTTVKAAAGGSYLPRPLFSGRGKPASSRLRSPRRDNFAPEPLFIRAYPGLCGHLWASRSFPWAPPGTYGPLWASMGLSRALWGSLGLRGLSGPTWAFLGLSGHLWAFLGLSGPLWASLGRARPMSRLLWVSSGFCGFLCATTPLPPLES